ncbi:MAG: hypothetical protein V4621_01350 [Pseudomonadota bacterium]
MGTPGIAADAAIDPTLARMTADNGFDAILRGPSQTGPKGP